MIFFLLVLCFK